MKPKEILSMIEEAAGTSLYESKKQSALKTIEKKDNKLTDINKILDEELNPTLEKLKAERASYLEYQKIQRHIETLTRLVVAYKYTRAQHVDQNAAGEVLSLQDQINTVDNEVGASKSEIERLKEEICRLEQTRKGQASSKLEELETEMTDMSKREVKATSDLDNVLDAVRQEEKEKESMLRSIANTEKLISNKSEELTAVREEAEKYKELEEKERGNVERAESNYTQVQAGQMEGEDGEQLTYTEHLMKLKDSLSEAQTANQQANLKLAHSQSTIKKMENDCKKAEREIAREKGEFDTAVTVVEGVERRIEKLGFSHEEVHSELQNEKCELENKVAKASKQVNELVNKFPQLQFDYVSPDRHFDRSRVKGLVADLFTVPDNQYAMALEVAAGGRLYNVVTDNEDTSALLIKHGQLRRRYVMIPLNKIRSNVIDREVVNSAKRLVGGDNCHLALDVIQFDKQVEPAMKFCFGGVLICKTKEQAKKVAFDKSVKRKVITLEGDVYDPAGTLTGGSRNTSRCVLKELSACKQSRSDLTQYKEQYRQVEGELSKMERVVHEWEELKGQLRLKKHERDLLEERLKQTSHYKDIEELRRTKEDLAKQKEIVDNFNDKEKSLLKKCAEVEAKMKNFKSEQEKELKKSERRILDAKSKLNKCSKEAKAKVNKLKELELEVSSELAKELEGLREQLPKCEEAIAAAQELVEGAQLKLTECAAVREALAAELGAQRELIQQCSAEIENFVKEQKAAEKLISSCGIKLKELTHKLSKLNKEASEAKQQVQYYLNNYEWIASEKQYFGQRDTAYDFEKQDLKESDKKLERLKASKEKLSKNVNMRAMHLLGEAEKRYIDLVKRKDIVTNDKHKINKVIKELDEKKNRAVRRAWEQVNKDFGSIFSTLLPGARVKLQTLEGRPVTDGLEVKVGFGEVWKESLTELSGGQRSLVALSLILSLLLFKPAPLYILDEVDAALDLSHTQNIGQMLRAHFKHSQFVVVSLKDGMFQNANVLFRTKFVDGVSAVTRHTQHSSTKPVLSEKENIQPLAKKNKKQKV
ncbi:structural maintenance of chromosomes protein 2-like [Bolinopsis microptera]|uniref:structural maintenance of chromosomes protein 2-like n=1 Tax=Bolinopsis microptera TaxID=2820187 RepID=UPI003078C55C